jgi:hypothetical protein
MFPAVYCLVDLFQVVFSVVFNVFLADIPVMSIRFTDIPLVISVGFYSIIPITYLLCVYSSTACSIHCVPISISCYFHLVCGSISCISPVIFPGISTVFPSIFPVNSNVFTAVCPVSSWPNLVGKVGLEDM